MAGGVIPVPDRFCTVAAVSDRRLLTKMTAGGQRPPLHNSAVPRNDWYYDFGHFSNARRRNSSSVI